MNSNNKTARIAGILYLVVIVCGIFSELYVRANIKVHGDAITTANNVIASESLYRLGFVSDLIMITSYFLVALSLYIILKSVNKNLAVVMVLFNLISIPIMCINMLNHSAALVLMSGANYLKVFEPEQLQALVLLFLNFHNYGYLIAELFFGLYLFPLGYLVFKSGYLPKVLGVLLIIGSIGDLTVFFTFFLIPSHIEIISQFFDPPAGIAELSLCLWLLIKGVKQSAIDQ
jgi:hypothetical protein